MDDLISRQAAIDALNALHYNDREDWCFVLDTVEFLPPVQPEIIRCKDCKHRDKFGCCKHWEGWAQGDMPIATDDNDFCSYAEQR